jgi:hypothetical protein
LLKVEMMMYAPHQDPNTIMMIKLVEERFNLMFKRPDLFIGWLTRGLSFKNSIDVSAKIGLFSSFYMFSEEMLDALVSGGEAYNTAPAAFIWERLVHHRVMIKAFGHLPGVPLAQHQIDVAMLSEHLKSDTFVNLFAPASGLVDRYSGAVIAIDVMKNGDKNRGSGFLVQPDDNGSIVLVTCRHNVDPEENILIERLESASKVEFSIENPTLSQRYDIACIPVNTEVVGPVFRLTDDVAVFDDVYTLGFPKVAGAYPFMAGHHGEVNGFAELYLEQCPVTIVSNYVAPGSSGCPILRSDGRCIGMTIRWLEGDTDGEKTRFSAALPARLIREFLLTRE